MATDYLTVADVLEMHAELILRHGGAPGVRDPGALEAALFRPQSGYYDDIVQEAAALMESLAINHPFVDGNKRIAFASVDVLFRINGYRIRGRPMTIHRRMMRLFDTGTFELRQLDAMLREFVVAARWRDLATRPGSFSASKLTPAWRGCPSRSRHPRSLRTLRRAEAPSTFAVALQGLRLQTAGGARSASAEGGSPPPASSQCRRRW